MNTPPVNGSGVWRYVLRVIAWDRKRFMWVVLFGMLSTAAGLLEPIIYREAVNDVSGLFVDQAVKDTRRQLGVDVPTSAVRSAHHVREPHRPGHVARRTPDQVLTTLLWSVGLLFLVNVAGRFFWWTGEKLNVRFSCAIERRYLRNTFGHVLRLPLRFFSDRSSSAIVKRMDMTEPITEILNGISQQILPEVVSLIGILAIMVSQNLHLTLIALSVVPVYLWLAWRSSKRLETGLDTYYEQWEVVTARMQDAVSGIKTVKLNGAEAREVATLEAAADKAYSNYTERSLLSDRYVFWETALTYLVSALVLAYGGFLALHHKLTPGDVVMFVAFIDRLYDPIDALSTLWVDMQQNAASLSRSLRLLDNEAEEPEGAPFTVEKGAVEFRDLTFGYKPDRPVLHAVSFRIEPGRKTAIVGPSGAGKTTTVDLLLKLFEPWSGSIVVDGQVLANASPSDVRRHIGMVLADGMVFRGTLAENIRYGRDDATEVELLGAAAAAGLGHTLERLPNGLHTEVGEGGIGLSVGERQRVQIARVLVNTPKILVLDEATANLDFATEAEIKRTIDQVRRSNTVIVIAHRFSMVEDADHVIVLEDGRVTAQGPPAELIASGGWFAEFASAEAEETEETSEEAMDEGEDQEEDDLSGTDDEEGDG